MFLEILKTLVRVITVFSILIIAFGLAFYILLSGEVRNLVNTSFLTNKNQLWGKIKSLNFKYYGKLLGKPVMPIINSLNQYNRYFEIY